MTNPHGPSFIPDWVSNVIWEAKKAIFRAPLVADLVSIVAAVTPTNVALTIAAQPDTPRKLQIRTVIDTTHTITAGSLTLVGIDQDGNTISEVLSLITAASQTVKSTYAYAHLTSATVAAIAITGGAGGTTVGIGRGNALGLQSAPNIQGQMKEFKVFKANKIVSTFTGSGTAVTTVAAVPVDEAVGTVDTVARTIEPTTAPGATATTSTDYEFCYNYQRMNG